MFKLDLKPLSPKLKKNREAHVNYLKITKDNADTLRDIVEQARISNPSDNALEYACLYAKQIQEFGLVCISWEQFIQSNRQRFSRLLAAVCLTILLGLPEDIYAAVDSCETAQEIWLRVLQMMKCFDIGIKEKKAKLFNEWEMFTSTDGESIESYYHRFLKLMNDFKRNKHFPEKITRIANQNGNGNVVAALAEGNENGNNGNQIRCYNCKGLGHLARNCIVRPRRRDAAYLQTQLLIAQKEEAGIQLQAEEFDLMAVTTDLDEIEEVNANCIWMANFQQASTSGGGTVEQHSATVEETRKQIMALNEEISNLNKQLLKEKSTVSSLQEEKKRLKSDFKIREDELLDKQIQLENKIKELDNILVKTGQSIQTMHMLSPKPDSFYHTEQKMALGYQNPFYLKQAQQKQQSLYNGKVLLEKHDPPVVYDSEETLELAQESRLKMKQLNKEIKPANYTKINHLSGVFVSQTAKSREELYFLNTSKIVNVSKSI
ncbi:retrovirus-related pol polyprotein from transposon TNT 1-94 [Tanacetum coccineum]